MGSRDACVARSSLITPSRWLLAQNRQMASRPVGGHLPVLLFALLLLPRLWQLASGAQAARADVDITHDATNLEAAAMHIQHEAAARALLREVRMIAIERLALAYFTTT